MLQAAGRGRKDRDRPRPPDDGHAGIYYRGPVSGPRVPGGVVHKLPGCEHRERTGS